jgi:hypothetical protein
LNNKKEDAQKALKIVIAKEERLKQSNPNQQIASLRSQ